MKFAPMIEVINIHFFALVFAVIAYVYSFILTAPGMILNGWWKFLERLPGWLFKPLVDCHKCVSGQFALWTGWYFLDFSRPMFEIVSLYVYYICLTILISTFIGKLND